MDTHEARFRVRRRLLSAVPGTAVFIALGLLGVSDTWHQPWLFVGVGMALSATFLEPYFSTPRAATVNSVGGIAACIAANTQGVTELWLALIAFLTIIFLSGATASITDDGRINDIARRLAGRFGHAVPIGTVVLLLIMLTEAQQGRSDFKMLALATAILVASISFEWADLWSNVRRASGTATAIAAVGPRMILITGAPEAFTEGDAVELSGSNSATTTGSVIGKFPHASGLRYQIVLADEWLKICNGFPQAIGIQGHTSPDAVVGAVADGTTQRTIDFEPFKRLSIGDPLLLPRSGEPSLLYQVARLKLANATWLGSSAVAPRATAHLIGSPESNHIRAVSYLPHPHAVIRKAENLGGALDNEYYEIGFIKGTKIPIGLRTDDERRGHIAVLGMSGMGKTGVAQRICSTLGQDHVIVALDTTGEYKSRLGFSDWTQGDFDTTGHFVYQPQGDPPLKAKEFIEECMKAGAQEYEANENPKKRVIALEEAHTFLPEWNFAIRPQGDHVAFSTRMIMQARKFGLTFLLVSQRTAVVSKSALSQCENYIILKTLDHTGLEYLESLVGAEMRDAIPTLSRYEAMCVGPAFNAEEPVIVSLSPP